MTTFTNTQHHAYQVRDRHDWRAYGAVMLAMAIVPPLAGDFGLYLGCVVICYAIAAIGLQVMVGVAGQLSLGHAAFMGIGAYATVLLQMKFGLHFVIAAALGIVLTALFGLLMAQLIRLSGIYFKIATFGFGVIVYQSLANFSSLTGGHTGLTGIPKLQFFGAVVETRWQLFLVLFVVFAIAYALAVRMIHGRAGRAFAAIGQNEAAASSLGVNVPGHKVGVIVIGCCFAGLGGVFIPQLNGFVNPDHFTWLESLLLLIMISVGGLGSLAGAVAGAALLVVVPEYLRDFAEYKMLIFGLILIVSLTLMPKGLAGAATLLLNKRAEGQAK
jgi:branched-chain amino acid transport system permease protein